MLHGTLQTESGGRVSGRLIYWKMHNELMQAASVKPDTLLFVKAQLGVVFICRSLLEKQAGEAENFLKVKHYVKFRRFFGRWKSAKREDGKFI